jgi:hypothetical protein
MLIHLDAELADPSLEFARPGRAHLVAPNHGLFLHREEDPISETALANYCNDFS